MTITAIVLILISAVTHAAWNLLGKRETPSAAFFLCANTVGCVLMLPVLAVYWNDLPGIPPAVWTLVCATGLCQAVYFAGLAGAYAAGDMSVAYPIARSAPIIAVTAAAFVMGRGHDVSGQCIAGIVLVVIGCFAVPMRHFSDLRLQNYLNGSCLLALVAALGTAGYTIIDDEALRLLRNTPETKLRGISIPLVYISLESLSTSVWLGAGVFLFRRERAMAARVLLRQRRAATITGVGIYVTYGLVLVSMAFVADVSYVAAFRQISIPLGALLGVVVLHEPPHRPKFVGVCIMVAGLVLVALG